MGKTECNSNSIKTALISLKGDANQFLNELIAGASKSEAPKEDNHKREDESHHHRKRKRDEERKEIIPLHLRPRKLNFWDQRPEGYANMSADQVKATGMFLLPSHLLKGNDFSLGDIVCGCLMLIMASLCRQWILYATFDCAALWRNSASWICKSSKSKTP